MRKIGFSKYERHLSERTTEALKQMTELEQLRELVRLAEAAKALNRPKGLGRSPIKPQIVEPFASPHLRDLPGRLRRPDQPSGG
jgi:hypothetical protein